MALIFRKDGKKNIYFESKNIRNPNVELPNYKEINDYSKIDKNIFREWQKILTQDSIEKFQRIRESIFQANIQKNIRESLISKQCIRNV